MKRTGSRGFTKAANDLLIKDSRDLIQSGEFAWRTKAHRNKAKEMKQLESHFNEEQKRLLQMNVDEEDAVSLTNQNKILSFIAACKERHNGPVTNKKVLESMVRKLKTTKRR